MTGTGPRWPRAGRRSTLTRRTSPGKIARRTQSRTRLLAVWVAVEIAIAGAAVPVLVYLAWVARDAVERAAMGTLSVACLAVLVFVVWNWRGAWRSRAASQQAFVELSLVRCRRFRRAIGVGWLLLAVEIFCFVPWIALRLGAGAPAASLGAYTFLALFAIGGVLFLLALARWVSREETIILGFARELEG